MAAALLAAALLSWALTPLTARLARRTGAIDRPGAARRVHTRPTPRGGGLAVTAAFVLVGLGVLALNAQVRIVPILRDLDLGAFLALFGGIAVAAVVGYVDDRWQLRARWQLIAQIALAFVAIAAGVTIDFVNNPFGGGVVRFDWPFANVFTVLWIVGMINSINFIDGLDGLSSGIAMIAAATLGLISITAFNQPLVAVLCAVFVGALAGFLPWNFHPARIFVGTAGVYAVGYGLAVLSIIGTAKVAVALLVLGVPIIDTFWIIVRRVLERRSPFTPDRGHIHHRLLDLGLTHRQAVVSIYAMCAALAVLSLVLSGTGQLYAFLGVFVGLGVALYTLTRRSHEALEAESYEDS